MEMIISKTNSYTYNQQQLMLIIFSCPLGNPSNKCFLLNKRKEFKDEYNNAIESFEIKEIPKLLTIHKNCLINRVLRKKIALENKKRFNMFNNDVYLTWTGQGNIDILLIELMKRKWIKTKKNFKKLFANNKDNSRIFWNMQFKYELAYLLYELKERGFFQIVNSKGYFKYVENFICDYSKNYLPKNTLKFINHKIINNRKKYAEVINEVELMMKTITI